MQQLPPLLPYCKLLESRRKKTRHPEAKGEDYPKYWRVCVECERRLRLEDWALWAQEEKIDDPTYCDPHRVDKDQKLITKGTLRVAKGEQLTRAREEIAAEQSGATEEEKLTWSKRDKGSDEPGGEVGRVVS